MVTRYVDAGVALDSRGSVCVRSVVPSSASAVRCWRSDVKWSFQQRKHRQCCAAVFSTDCSLLTTDRLTWTCFRNPADSSHRSSHTQQRLICPHRCIMYCEYVDVPQKAYRSAHCSYQGKRHNYVRVKIILLRS